MSTDLPAIAVVAFAAIAIVRAVTTRHRRRSITIIIEDRANGDAKEPAAPPPEGQDGGLE